MNRIKSIYKESYLAYIVGLIITRVVPALRKTVADSFLMHAWFWFNKVVLSSAPVRLLFDTKYIANIWYSSFFYKAATHIIRKIAVRIPASSINFSCMFIGIFLAVIFLTPEQLLADSFWIPLFAALALFYISRNTKSRIGTVFILVNVVLLLFLLLAEFSLPLKSVVSVSYFLLGIDLFFLISFAVRTEDDVRIVTMFLFGAAALLCGIGFAQNIAFKTAASATFADGVGLGEILMLIFPFVLVYPLQFEKQPRKSIYSSFIFILFLNAISATHSKAAFIGFLVEIAIFVLSDIRFIPSLIILIPFGLGSIIDNFSRTVYSATLHGNIITNIINLFRRIWNQGFGVNSQKLMDLYDVTELKTATETSMLSIPHITISPIYKNIIIDIGAVIMVIFLSYILRLAHSALTLSIVSEKKYRRYFVAGLATLVAISVSAFFETTLFQPRTMLTYWAMLGLLRAIRIMSFGLDKKPEL